MSLAAIALAMAIGGILKGATGAGAPLAAVPVMTAIHDVRFAVAVMVLPSLLTNLAQIRRYRGHDVQPGFARNMAVAGGLGAATGTFLLVTLPVSLLQLAMAGMIFAYIGLRLAKPSLQLGFPLAGRLVGLAGFAGGVLQGAVGVSAPIALTFLNAMRLDRPTFILTVSTFFAAMSAMQLVSQVWFGVMTLELAVLGALAILPLIGAMPAGEWLGRRFSAKTFDRVILCFLALLAVRLVWAELA